MMVFGLVEEERFSVDCRFSMQRERLIRVVAYLLSMVKIQQLALC